MIVRDEHLRELGVADAIRRWYRGRVCVITELRPGSVIKDDGIPHLLRSERQPTFVTLNWNHFWQRAAPHDHYCIICLVLPTDQVRQIAPLLRRLLRLPAFRARAARMGKVARVSGGQVAFYQVSDPQTYVLPLP
jgi:hypothetical protein